MSEFSSQGKSHDSWKSPRRIAEEARNYVRKRFESYMGMEDRGELTRELALSALREELIYAAELDEQPVTQPMRVLRWDDPDRFDVFGTDD